jgi:hypothetical protein
MLPLAQLLGSFGRAFVYRGENWFATLREEHRLKVMENRTVRVMFGLRLRKGQDAETNSIVRNFRV